MSDDRMTYLSFLAHLHALLSVDMYIEIGVRDGRSLALARGRSISIDPDYHVTSPQASWTKLFRLPSDDFFATHSLPEVMERPHYDLAFIDGLHLFEQALRDFIHLERHAGPGSVIVFDDVLPRTAREATRQDHGGAWTGDIWKVMACLQESRPDLILIPVATFPTGLLIVANLDPGSRILTDTAASLERRWVGDGTDQAPPPDWVKRFYLPETILAAPVLTTLAGIARAGQADRASTRLLSP